MWDRAWGKASDQGPEARGPQTHKPPQREYSLGCETLEGRRCWPRRSPRSRPSRSRRPWAIRFPRRRRNSAAAQSNVHRDLQQPRHQGDGRPGAVRHVQRLAHRGQRKHERHHLLPAPVTFQLFNDLTPPHGQNIENFVSPQGFYTATSHGRFHRGTFPGLTQRVSRTRATTDSSRGARTTATGLATAVCRARHSRTSSTSSSPSRATTNGDGQSGPDTNDTQFFITDRPLHPPCGAPVPRLPSHDFRPTGLRPRISSNDMTKAATGSDGTTPVSPITDHNRDGLRHQPQRRYPHRRHARLLRRDRGGHGAKATSIRSRTPPRSQTFQVTVGHHERPGSHRPIINNLTKPPTVSSRSPSNIYSDQRIGRRHRGRRSRLKSTDNNREPGHGVADDPDLRTCSCQQPSARHRSRTSTRQRGRLALHADRGLQGDRHVSRTRSSDVGGTQPQSRRQRSNTVTDGRR